MDLSKLPKLSGDKSKSPVEPPPSPHPIEKGDLPTPPPPNPSQNNDDLRARPPGYDPMADRPPHDPHTTALDGRTSIRTEPYDASPGSIWISLVLGLIFVFLGVNFGKWLAATAAGKPFATGVNWTAGPKAGQPVEYWDLSGGTAWTECGMFLFGVSSMIDGLVLAMCWRSARSRLLGGWIGALVTAAATLFNLVVVAKLMSMGITPIFSLLAVAVGGYVLLDHYRTILTRHAR